MADRPGATLARAGFTAAQAGAAAVVVARLARGRRRRPRLSAAVTAPAETISVVIPARDEEARLAPCLAGLRADGDASEVLVVDDRSTDATAAVARAGGARVVAGQELPDGWVGKAWALQQGLGAANGDIVVFLDADTRPRPGLLRALAARLAGDTDLVTVGPCFECRTAAERLLHPSMAATIPYRVGPGDVEGWQPAPGRAMANGQCLAMRRDAFLAFGGMAPVRGFMTDDIALARALRRAGWRLAMADATDLLDVRMYASARETWEGWGRSLLAPDVNPPLRRAEDLAVLWLAMALPLPRVLLGRGTPLDALLLALRAAMTAALARSYRPRGLPFWLSPLADVPTMSRLSWSALRPTRTWRGRTYA
ncbi:MAG TPA: glycosyltransferase [Solirubrobacteraceae bacterium]|nr:glycosyltransferase [Solirubrobacteraceae bacterium]